MKIKTLEFLVLAILAIIVTVVACAQKKKPNLTPTKDQAQMLSAAQAELKVAADNLLQVQQTFNQVQSKTSWVCQQIVKANNWPAETTCSANTAKSYAELFNGPITFAVAEKQEPGKK